MRIEGNRSRRTKQIQVSQGKSLSQVHRHMGNFEEELKDREEKAYIAHLQELLNEIDKTQERLARHLDLNDLMRYKRLVQEFLNEVVKRTHLIEKEASFTKRGARSLMVSVRRVNEELQVLLDIFYSRAQDPINILETLEKIRGMLLDLMA